MPRIAPVLLLAAAISAAPIPAARAESTPAQPAAAEPAAQAAPASRTSRPLPGKLQRGDTPPPFLGVTRDGDEVVPAQFAGKVLIVTFWASWCGPCLKELPILEGMQGAGKGSIQVVAVNIEDRDIFRKVSSSLASLKLKITHDYRKKGSDAFGVQGIPHMVIIGRDGKVKQAYRGYSEDGVDHIIGEVNKALKEEG